jgi:hypothetical protein
VLKGDDWSHTAVDPEHRLLLSLVPGKRTGENSQSLVDDTKRRTGGRTDLLPTGDEHSPYETAIEKAYAVEVPRPKRPGPGRPPKPDRVMPKDLCYATVRKTRKQGRVVEVVRTLVFGTAALLDAMLERSTASSTVNTSFVERSNGTERGMNARTTRKTYCFPACRAAGPPSHAGSYERGAGRSRGWDLHNAAVCLIGFSHNFCWPVRTLRLPTGGGRYQPRRPAMAAGLADHVWTTAEWIAFPSRPP